MAVRNDLAVAWARANIAHIFTQRTQALFQAIHRLLNDEEVDDELLQHLAALGIAKCDTILTALQEAQDLLEPMSVFVPPAPNRSENQQEG